MAQPNQGNLHRSHSYTSERCNELGKRQLRKQREKTGQEKQEEEREGGRNEGQTEVFQRGVLK